MVRKTTLVILSLMVLAGSSLNTALGADNTSALAPDTTSAAISAGHKIVAYYLYMKPRCETCLNIEKYSKEAIESAFADELKSGRVEWHAYDTDLPEYEHYWKDFKLESKSLVIVEMENGKQVRSKICEQVWDLVSDKPEFEKYVQTEVRAYLTGGK